MRLKERMNVLILKLGATGDVVRTTPLLSRLKGDITWITAQQNKPLLDGLLPHLNCFSWEERHSIQGRRFDLIINLEDTIEVAAFLRTFDAAHRFGAYSDSQDTLRYTEDSRDWFDLSLISSYGRQEADRLKLANRRTYQEMIFEGLGFRFLGETYLLPKAVDTGLQADVAIAPDAGAVWPMKRWAHYDELKTRLERAGLTVNVLGSRPTLLEHLADVQGHRVLVSGDTLPMHFALGSGVRCVTLFNCTSPWEIYDYGIQSKIVSPVLKEFFYQRGRNERAIHAISVEEVLTATLAQLELATPKPGRKLARA
jgi:heptosyltransferase-2